MKTLSFRDLQLCEEFAGMNEISMLHPDNDAKMEKVLAACGLDVEYPVLYIPTKHRCMGNKVAVGFQCVGEISINRAYLKSAMCSTTERMVAASYTDPSLTRELANLMGGTVNYRSLQDESIEFEGDELPEDMLEPDRVEVAKQIKQLTEIRDVLRGSPYNEAGDLKTFAEYK